LLVLCIYVGWHGLDISFAEREFNESRKKVWDQLAFKLTEEVNTRDIWTIF